MAAQIVNPATGKPLKVAQLGWISALMVGDLLAKRAYPRVEGQLWERLAERDTNR